MMSEEEQVRDVERILDAGATHREVRTRHAWRPGGRRRNRDDRVNAKLALWLCACYDDDLSPTWLIVGGENELAWYSLPDGTDVDDVVDADLVAGSHLSSLDVLQWLSGTTSMPGDYCGDHLVAHRISALLTSTPS